MCKHNLILNVNPETFTNWLNRYMITMIKKMYTDKEIWQSEFLPFRLWPMKPTTERVYRETNDFYVEIQPLNAERVEVTLDCKTQEGLPYFNELLAEIERRWPSGLIQVDSLEIPSHPLKDRRMKVLEMAQSGNYFESEIAKEIKESVDVVKQDKRWLRQRGFLLKKR